MPNPIVIDGILTMSRMSMLTNTTTYDCCMLVKEVMLWTGHCSHVQNGEATPSEQRNGSKDWPKIGAGRAGPPFSAFQVGSMDLNLQESFRFFPCLSKETWGVLQLHGLASKIREELRVRGSQWTCGWVWTLWETKSTGWPSRFHLYLAMGGRALSWRQSHVLGHSSFWAACASGFKGKHQVIPYADGGIMVY